MPIYPQIPAWSGPAPATVTNVADLQRGVAYLQATAGTIPTGGIGTTQIASGAITAAQIAAGTITAGQIAAGTITATLIAAGTITANLLYAGTVQANLISAANIAANSITAGNIAANTITAGQIQANTITATQIAAGTITATQITAGTITATQIAAGTITAGQITAGTITATQIAAGTITAGNIQANTITAGQITAGTITATEIAAGTIVAGNIQAGTITATQIAAGSITAGNIQAHTITAGQIQAGTITATEIAANSITAGKIVAGSITTTELAATTIVAGNIAAHTITAGQIKAGTITATEISANTITAGQIQAGTITATEISAHTITAGQITAGSITTNEIAATTITAGNIAAGAITAGKIAAGAITATTVSANAITAGTIAAGAVTAGTIAAGAVTATTVSANAITAGTIAAGAVTAGTIAAGAVTASTIAAGAITADKISAGSITSNEIAAHTITAGNIVAGTITATEIKAGTIVASNITAGTITSNEIKAGTILASNIAAGVITGGLIAGGTITASNLAAGSVTATQIAVSSLSAVSAAMGTVTGGIFQTNTTGARMMMGTSIITSMGTNNGIIGVDSGGNVTLFADATTGNITLKGDLLPKSTGLGNINGITQNAVLYISGNNLLINGAFDTSDLSGVTNLQNCTAAYDNTTFLTQPGSLALTCTTAGTLRFIPAPIVGSSYNVPVTLGLPYSYGFSVRTPNGETSQVQVQFRASSNIVFQETIVTSTVAGQWTPVMVNNKLAPINMAPNPSVETNLTGWSATGNTAAPTRNTTQAYDGTASARSVSTASGGVSFPVTSTGTAGFPVSPGSPYTAGVMMKADAAYTGTWVAHIAWYDGTGTFLSNSTFGTGVAPSTSWQLVSTPANCIAPASAAFAAFTVVRTAGASGEAVNADGLGFYMTTSAMQMYSGSINYLVVYNQILGATVGAVYNVDNQILVQQPNASGGQIVAGSITATEIAAGTITATQITAGTITAALLSAGAVTAGTIAAGAIDGKTITGATVQTASSGARVVMDATGINSYNASNVNQVSISSTDGSISLPNGSVTAANLAVGAVTATSISAGAIDGKTITGATIQTSNLTGARIILDASGLNAYSGAGAPVSTISSATGIATFIGANIQTASGTGARVTITTSGLIAYNSSNVPTVTISSTDGSISLPAGSVTASNIVASSITSVQLSASAIDGMTITGATMQTSSGTGARVVLDSTGLRSYNASNALQVSILSSNGAITLPAGSVTAANIVANSITADQMYGGQSNLVPNPSFEYDTINATPQYWTFAATGTSIVTHAVTTGGTTVGANAYRITTASSTASGQQGFAISSATTGQRIPVSPSAQFYARCGVKTFATHTALGAMTFQVQWYSATNSLITTQLVSTFSTTAASSTYSFAGTVTAPSTAFTAVLRVFCTSTASGQVGDFAIDAVCMSPGALPQSYGDGDTSGWVWTGTPGGSTSLMMAGTITGQHLIAGTLSAQNIAAGSITATQIAAGAITATTLAANAIDGKTITGVVIQSSATTTTPRTIIDSTGLYATSASNAKMVSLDHTNGIQMTTGSTSPPFSSGSLNAVSWHATNVTGGLVAQIGAGQTATAQTITTSTNNAWVTCTTGITTFASDGHHAVQLGVMNQAGSLTSTKTLLNGLWQSDYIQDGSNGSLAVHGLIMGQTSFVGNGTNSVTFSFTHGYAPNGTATIPNIVLTALNWTGYLTVTSPTTTTASLTAISSIGNFTNGTTYYASYMLGT